MDIRIAEDLCMSCGACCAYFRVSFYWGETDLHPDGDVPSGCTDKLDAYRSVMQGTDSPAPRCSALEGRIGSIVRCSIYAKRPSPCREFSIHGQDGPNDSCNRARIRHGLPVIDFDMDRAG